mmetsp:Transcript_28370/g.59438  ORF Transcript_28370/g.59438 Transcript_28370/m.59438 type:complete len:239 (+) Transcript_28370:139-855(+)
MRTCLPQRLAVEGSIAFLFLLDPLAVFLLSFAFFLDFKLIFRVLAVDDAWNQFSRARSRRNVNCWRLSRTFCTGSWARFECRWRFTRRSRLWHLIWVFINSKEFNLDAKLFVLFIAVKQNISFRINCTVRAVALATTQTIAKFVVNNEFVVLLVGKAYFCGVGSLCFRQNRALGDHLTDSIVKDNDKGIVIGVIIGGDLEGVILAFRFSWFCNLGNVLEVDNLDDRISNGAGSFCAEI